MAWKPKHRKYDWRDYLTPEEAQAVGRLEDQIRALDDALARRAELVAEIGPYRNRAVQRARYEAGLKGRKR